MTRLGLLIDVTRCSGCYNCFLACRDEHYGNDYPGYSAPQPLNGQFWLQMKEVEGGRYPRPRLNYIAVPCQHCQNAPCLDAARDGAVYRRDDGIVMIDPEKAKGQDQIADSCPYRVISWNAELELPQKCGMCAQRLDTGDKQPRCAESCPTGAMTFGDLDDPASEVSQRLQEVSAEAFHSEYGTDPLVLYAGLPGRMIAGEVVLEGADVCAAGVTVRLEGDGLSRETTTATFGDFAFERLPKGKAFKVTVAHEGYAPQVFEVKTHTDVDLGEVVLAK
ncbi:MAG: 4Fe-4S dicluster domain-containing protein [Deltaproteobacteria bacterium]